MYLASRVSEDGSGAMPQNGFVVMVRLSDGRSFTWNCESFASAKQKAMDIGLSGFFCGDEWDEIEGVEFVSPHRITEIKAATNPDLVCAECHTRIREPGTAMCQSCIEMLICQGCGSARKQAGSRFCPACHEQHVCGRCKSAERMSGERYCSNCKKEVLREMRENGYLADSPSSPAPKRRVRTEPSDDRQGDWDNAIRAGEDGPGDE